MLDKRNSRWKLIMVHNSEIENTITVTIIFNKFLLLLFFLRKIDDNALHCTVFTLLLQVQLQLYKLNLYVVYRQLSERKEIETRIGLLNQTKMPYTKRHYQYLCNEKYF